MSHDSHYVTQEQFQGEMIRLERRICASEDRINTKLDTINKDLVEVKTTVGTLKKSFNDELDDRINAKNFRNRLIIAGISAGAGGGFALLVSFIKVFLGL